MVTAAAACAAAAAIVVIPWRGLRSLGYEQEWFRRNDYIICSNPLAGIEVFGILNLCPQPVDLEFG